MAGRCGRGRRGPHTVAFPGVYFPVGCRTEHGESLIDCLHREVQEELGVPLRSYRLLYTNENFFPAGDEAYHEFGW